MIDEQKIVQGIRRQLIGSGWDKELRMFLLSEDMKEIIRQLADSREHSGQFIPSMKECLRWLTYCPVHEVKVIMVIDEKQNIYGLHTGVPMSGITGRQPWWLLEKLLESIDPGHYQGGVDLSRWSRQGVLMIPLSPTYTIDKGGHHKIWKPFITYILNKVNDLYPEAPVIYLGNYTIQKVLRSPYQYLLHVVHGKDGGIIHENVWVRCNQILKNSGKKEIKW